MRGLFGTLARPRNEVSSLTFDQFAALLGGGVDTMAGISVSPESAMRFTTVLICVRVLSESVASLPCILYKRRKDGGKDRADGHPLYDVLHNQANGWNTSFELAEGTMANLAQRGNGYCYIDRNAKGQTIGLVPLNPDGVTAKMARDWSPLYTATMPDNTITELSRSQIHHVRGPLPKGYFGRSMISLARQGVGLGLALEEAGARLFSNGVRPSGYFKKPANTGTLTDPAFERLKKQLEERAGVSQLARPMLLEEGLEWVAQSINPDDAQFLEARKFQRAEIAGIFRVPMHLVNDLDKATFSNIEHQSLEFIVHSLRPWLVRWEKAMNRDLLAPSERGEYFVEFLIDGLLRGDFKTRMDGYAQGIQNGIYNPNEVRIKENLNPRDGGDEYWKPANMMGDQMVAKALINSFTPQARRALLVEIKSQLDAEAA